MKYKKLSLFVLTIFMVGCFNLSTVKAAVPFYETYEGIGNIYVTGEAYPNDIAFLGYDVTNSNYYLDYKLETTKSLTPGASWQFTYTIDILDENGNTITPIYHVEGITKTGAPDANIINVTNEALNPVTSLTAGYRLIITVTEITEV